MKLLIAYIILNLIGLNTAHSKVASLTQFSKDYNQAIKSQKAYLKWLSKYESADNIQFLEKYMQKNSAELRPMEIVNNEISFVGKKNYTRIKILDLNKGLIEIYGKNLRIPLHKPYSSIFKNIPSAKTSFLEVLKSSFISYAHASSDYSWSGESLDIFTSMRMWYRTNLSSTVYENGIHAHYCINPENQILESININEFASEDPEDNCYKVFLTLAEVTTHYNGAIEKYEPNVQLENRLLDAEVQTLSVTTGSRLAHATQNTQTPSCIINDILEWKRQFCDKFKKDVLRGCKITLSAPQSLFDCNKSYVAQENLPQKIKIGIGWESTDFNTSGMSGTSKGNK